MKIRMGKWQEQKFNKIKLFKLALFALEVMKVRMAGFVPLLHIIIMK